MERQSIAAGENASPGDEPAVDDPSHATSQSPADSSADRRTLDQPVSIELHRYAIELSSRTTADASTNIGAGCDTETGPIGSTHSEPAKPAPLPSQLEAAMPVSPVSASPIPLQFESKPWAPLTIPLYRSFWVAGLFSNLGTWMHETGAQWLMNELHGSPAWVSAVRTAMALPVFCLALPAGVWADRFDRRRWLICSQSVLLGFATLMAVLDWSGAMTPPLLLLLTTCMGIAMILNQPAWQALTPELVPTGMIPAAVAVGSVSFNLARSLGPALAGLLIASIGTWVTFLFNAISFLGVIAMLLMWRPEKPVEERPHASFWRELSSGLTWLAGSSTLRSVLGRVLLFTFPASGLWALLSIVASDKLHMGASGFGILLGAIGLGAVLGTSVLSRIRDRCSSEATVLWSSIMYAVACMALALPLTVSGGFTILLVVGVGWMTTMTTLNATAQIYLPRALRARGMSAYLMSFSCGMAAGSAFWGQIAQVYGINAAMIASGSVMIATSLITLKWPLGTMRT